MRRAIAETVEVVSELPEALQRYWSKKDLNVFQKSLGTSMMILGIPVLFGFNLIYILEETYLQEKK